MQNFESYDEGQLSYHRVPGKAALKLVVHQYSLSVCIVSSVTDNCPTKISGRDIIISMKVCGRTEMSGWFIIYVEGSQDIFSKKC